jgi:hypothetical protein
MPASRSLAARLLLLREQANACRAQAIVLNAKLSLMERDNLEVRAVREYLARSSARLDHAIDDLERCAKRR